MLFFVEFDEGVVGEEVGEEFDLELVQPGFLADFVYGVPFAVFQEFDGVFYLRLHAVSFRLDSELGVQT